MTSSRRTLPRRVESARDALVSYIHDRRLSAGDRLPAYAQLRAKFGFGSQTIAAAVDSLCQLGVLEVRDKVGLFVLNPAGGNLVGRNIAVIVRRLRGSAYAATLAGFLQKQIGESGCCCLTFYQSSDPLEVPVPGLEEFAGLEQALRERHCDGVITLCPLSENALKSLKYLNVNCCFIGDDDQLVTAPAVVIEVRRFIADATLALKQKGCRNIIQLCATDEQAVARSGELPVKIGNSYGGGVKIAGELLALSKELRPDGIISDDDTIVSGFLAELIKRQLPQISYLPFVATIVHQELGERYPSGKVILFQQEIEKYAKQALQLLLDNIQGKNIENQIKYYRLVPVTI